MRSAITASPLKSDLAFPEGTEVVQVSYGAGRLTVHVAALGAEQEAMVAFPGVEAFRVMDERDLQEYWPTCSTPNGWIFEVHEGGWLSQEFERPGSLIPHMHRGLKEYLVTGNDACVSVLAVGEPDVFDPRAAPPRMHGA